MDDDDLRALDATVTGCAGAHQTLLAHLDALVADGTLTDNTARSPSLLDGWTVGHVLTHIARNADGFTGILAAAERGEIADQYEGGVEGRAAGIEGGTAGPRCSRSPTCGAPSGRWNSRSPSRPSVGRAVGQQLLRAT